MNNTLKAITIAVFSVLAFAGTSQAGWMDDWFDQSTTMNPSAYKGQQRNYATGGGMSVRWKGTTDYPISISGPRMNSSGCGGIDLFMGSMSFVDPEYLVSKLQNIASGAAVIALQVGLKTLNEPLATSIENTEHMLDALNQLQFDDCSTSKTLVTASAETFHGNTDGAKETLTKWRTDTGLDDVWDSGKKAYDDTTAWAAAMLNDAKDDIEGKTKDGEQIRTDAPSMIEEMISERSDLIDEDDLMALMKGLLGDIDAESKWFIDPVNKPGCAKNVAGEGLLEMFVNGEIHAMDESGVCSPMNSISINGISYDSIKDWVDTNTRAMLTAMVTPGGGGSPDTDVTHFINNVDDSIYLAGKTYSIIFQDADMAFATMDDIRWIAANRYAMGILDNVLGLLEKLYREKGNQVEAEANEKNAQWASKLKATLDKKVNEIRIYRNYMYAAHRLDLEKRQWEIEAARNRLDMYSDVLEKVSERLMPNKLKAM